MNLDNFIYNETLHGYVEHVGCWAAGGEGKCSCGEQTELLLGQVFFIVPLTSEEILEQED